MEGLVIYLCTCITMRTLISGPPIMLVLTSSTPYAKLILSGLDTKPSCFNIRHRCLPLQVCPLIMTSNILFARSCFLPTKPGIVDRVSPWLRDLLRLLLKRCSVQVHQFMSEYYFSLCDAIPQCCIQLRIIILSAIPVS